MAAMEPVEVRPEHHHSIAVEGFNGKTEVFEADELRVCVPTKECIQFWATIIACFVIIALGVFFMIYQGPNSAYYSVGLTMIGLGSGVLIPGASSPFSAQIFHFDQGPITESWLRRRQPDARPCIRMQTSMIKSQFRRNVKPSARSWHAVDAEFAHLQDKESCLKFEACACHGIQIVTVELGRDQKSLSLQPEGFFLEKVVIQVSAHDPFA